MNLNCNNLAQFYHVSMESPGKYVTRGASLFAKDFRLINSIFNKINIDMNKLLQDILIN